MLLNYYILILSKNTNITEGSYWEFRGLQYRSKWPTLNQQEEMFDENLTIDPLLKSHQTKDIKPKTLLTKSVPQEEKE